uniref:Uncharacterized protein n=1 Tax=Anguilla anguilla TaxID=7936 RepID=A0A0E9VBK9_ANGAN
MLMTVKSGQEAFSALQLAASASRFGHIFHLPLPHLWG